MNSSYEYKRISKQYEDLCAFDITKEIDTKTASTFCKNLKSITQDVHATVIQLLLENYPEIKESKIALATTGSDGREEKTGVESPVELILITDGDKSAELIEKIKKNTFSGLLNYFEVKDLKNPEKTGFVGEFKGPKKTKIIPTRALDAKFLCGDDRAFATYKAAMVSELVDKKYTYKEFKKGDVNAAKKALESFDATKELLYNENERVKGHKYGAMRLMQYGVAHKLFQMLQEQKVVASQIPQDVVSRLDFLRDKLSIAKDDIETLKENYQVMLVWYTFLQLKAVGSKEVKLAVDNKQLDKISKTTLDLMKKIL